MLIWLQYDEISLLKSSEQVWNEIDDVMLCFFVEPSIMTMGKARAGVKVATHFCESKSSESN